MIRSELLALIVVLLGLGLFFTLSSPFFLSWNNWLNILSAVAVTGIVAAPATMLLIAGQFDLSVGAGAAFVGAVLAVTLESNGLAASLALAIAAGLALGLLNGLLVSVVRVNALIATLGTLAIFRGFTRLITDGQNVRLDGFSWLGTSRLPFRVPVAVAIFAGVMLLFGFIGRSTVFGRRIYAVGSNPVAARLSGIKPERVVFSGFLISAACVTLSGLILVSQLGAASPNAATGLEFAVITAVVLGGTTLAGGKGTILGTLLGLLIIAVLNNGLTLLNISSFWQEVARGTLLILAVSLDQIRRRLSNK